MIVIVGPNYLFEIQNCIAQIIQFLQSFCLVKVRFAQASRLLVRLLCNFGEL